MLRHLPRVIEGMRNHFRKSGSEQFSIPDSQFDLSSALCNKRIKNVYEFVHERPVRSSFADLEQVAFFDQERSMDNVEILLPHHDMPDVAVHIAPRQFFISSGIDEA